MKNVEVSSDSRNELDVGEDLVDVLTEFYQRGQRERESQVTGIPQPLDIRTSVQSLGHVAPVQEPTRVVDNSVEAPSTSVKPETEFDFGQYFYTATGSFSFRLQMQISCHNAGAIPTDPLSIGVAEAVWFGPQNPPAHSGNLSVSWDNSYWWPSKKGSALTIATVNCTLAGAPNLVPNYVRVRFSLRHTAPPYDWVRTLFYAGQKPEIWTVRNNVYPADISARWGIG